MMLMGITQEEESKPSNALEYDPAKKCVTVGAQNETKIGLDLEKRNYRKIRKES